MGSADFVSLNVIVVGGGICGLACAIGLRSAGHNVTIYETRSRAAVDAVEGGAGIIVSPNASRVLHQWGLDPESVGMLKYERGFLTNGKTLQKLKEVRADSGEDQLADGERRYMATRQDLRDLLRDRALAESHSNGNDSNVDKWGSIQINYESRVVDYDTEKPAVQLSNGTWQNADLVIASNGIKSKASAIVVGHDSPATPTGYSAFRLTVPTKELAKSEIVRQYTDFGSGTVWFCSARDSKILVWWECHFGELQAFDIILPDSDNYASSEDWLAVCDKKILLKEFADWHPLIHEIVNLDIDNPLIWKICSREPLTTLYRNKLCILGDSLHPMPPFRAQGATQAVEDGAVLGICFSELQNKSEIPARLALLDKLRIPRVATVQLLSQTRADNPKEDEEIVKVIEKAKKYNPDLKATNKKELFQWLLAHDVRGEAKEALAELKSNGQTS